MWKAELRLSGQTSAWIELPSLRAQGCAALSGGAGRPETTCERGLLLLPRRRAPLRFRSALIRPISRRRISRCPSVSAARLRHRAYATRPPRSPKSTSFRPVCEAGACARVLPRNAGRCSPYLHDPGPGRQLDRAVPPCICRRRPVLKAGRRLPSCSWSCIEAAR
jgi:hypothetical protein